MQAQPAPTSEQTPSSVPEVCLNGAQPGPAYVRRLTNDEYARTAVDVLKLSSEYGSGLDLVVEGFGNRTEGLPVTPVHVERYQRAAFKLAQAALGDQDARARLVGCELSASTSCLTELVQNVGRRAFRRPLTAAEQQRLLDIAAQAATDTDGYMPAKLAITSLLLSPSFVYRVEAEVPASASSPRSATPDASLRALDGFEVATRLSYLLWGTTPDDDLLDRAERGELTEASGVESTTRRMLQDARARTGIESFLKDWLKLYEIDNVSRPADAYPEFTPELRASMARETKLFLNDFIWGAGAADFFGIFTAPYGYADPSLRSLYGLAPPTTNNASVNTSTPRARAVSRWARVEFGPDDPRMGLLTQPAMLALPVNGGELTAPILRGKFISDVFTCTSPPSPPPAIPTVSPDTSLTIRERLSEHAKNPGCAGCHNMLDPIGFGFEQYDLIGRHRTQGTLGEPLTGEGVFPDYDRKPIAFVGPKELAQLLADDQRTAGCMVRTLYKHAFAREFLPFNDCAALASIEAFERSQRSFPEVLVSLATSPTFRFVRRPQ